MIRPSKLYMKMSFVSANWKPMNCNNWSWTLLVLLKQTKFKFIWANIETVARNFFFFSLLIIFVCVCVYLFLIFRWIFIHLPCLSFPHFVIHRLRRCLSNICLLDEFFFVGKIMICLCICKTIMIVKLVQYHSQFRWIHFQHIQPMVDELFSHSSQRQNKTLVISSILLQWIRLYVDDGPISPQHWPIVYGSMLIRTIKAMFFWPFLLELMTTRWYGFWNNWFN